MDPGLVLVETVQHDLPGPLRLVGQLDLGKCDWLPLPVSTEVGAVRMHVDRALGRRLSLASSQPLPVNIFPAVVLDLNKLQQDGVHGAGVQS